MPRRPPQVVAGTPNTLVDLLRSAAIKVETVRLACLAWADEIITYGALPSLETLMAELPKDSSRTVVSAELTPAVEELLERYARRARRVCWIVCVSFGKSFRITGDFSITGPT